MSYNHQFGGASFVHLTEVAMSRLLVGLLTLLAPTITCAVPVFPPMDTATFVVKSTDLLVVRCLNPDIKGGEKNDGLTLIEVDVLMVLRGERKVGNVKLATIGQRMTKGERYLLANFGGSAFDTGFLAQSDQAVVELPPDFDLKSLAGVVLLEQVQSIFDARRVQVEQLIRRLQQEKAVLDQTAVNPTAPKN
jgi:hypothetical protein